MFQPNCCRVFYDGASQLENSRGGVGVVIWLNDAKVYKIALNCGPVTNTRSQVIALWTLLFCANKLGLKELRVFGDSKVIIDWIMNVGGYM